MARPSGPILELFSALIYAPNGPVPTFSLLAAQPGARSYLRVDGLRWVGRIGSRSHCTKDIPARSAPGTDRHLSRHVCHPRWSWCADADAIPIVVSGLCTRGVVSYRRARERRIQGTKAPAVRRTTCAASRQTSPHQSSAGRKGMSVSCCVVRAARDLTSTANRCNACLSKRRAQA